MDEIKLIKINGHYATTDAIVLRRVTYPGSEHIQMVFPFDEDFRVKQLTISEAFSLKMALEELLSIKLLGDGK